MTSIVDKVRKLLRLAESPNVNEAALAAAKAQSLIDEHNLSAALLALDTPEPDEPIEDFKQKGAPLYVEGASDRWRWALASVLMKANGCRGYGGRLGIQIVGRASDVDTVRYLLGYLVREVDRLANGKALRA